MNIEMNQAQYDQFSFHVGHKIECAEYGSNENIAIECITCGTILFDSDNPDIEFLD